MRVAVLGLGQMGRGIAANLIRAGHELSVFNRTRQKAVELGEQGARIANSPSDAVRGAEVLVTMLSDDAAVESMVLGGGPFDSAIASLPPFAVHLSMSTISPECSRRLRVAHAASSQAYVAAPVFGLPESAADATLSIVAAGPKEAVDLCLPILAAIGRETHYLGEPAEKANVAKVAGNFLIAAMIASMGEAFTLVEASGVPAKSFLDVVNRSLFQSSLYASYGQRIAERAFEPAGFRMRLGLKDMRIYLDAGERAQVPLPIGGVLRDRFLTAVSKGLEDTDWSAVARWTFPQAKS